MAKPQFVTKRELEAVKKDLYRMMRETISSVKKLLKPAKPAKVKLPKRKKQ